VIVAFVIVSFLAGPMITRTGDTAACLDATVLEDQDELAPGEGPRAVTEAAYWPGASAVEEIEALYLQLLQETVEAEQRDPRISSLPVCATGCTSGDQGDCPDHPRNRPLPGELRGGPAERMSTHVRDPSRGQRQAGRANPPATSASVYG
jgi:hypothetical protein